MESSPSFSLQDRRFRLIGIPLVALLVPLVTETETFLRFNQHTAETLLVSFCTTLLLWEGNGFIILSLRQRFPAYNQTTQRLLSEAVLALIYTFAATILLDTVLCHWLLGKKSLFIGFRMSLIPTLVIYLIYEAMYFFEAWKINVRKTESLAREAVQSQLEVLKNQLDPHFLFNSLNTLAALIDEENVPAQEYLNRLADVYRYVLVSRNKNTVPLEEEMAFLDAYVFLNKTRFRENLQVETLLSPETYHQHVTPLSLQMLVENAIKHNVVSKEKPLKISIQQDAGYLVVENNIQEKTMLATSTRVGLQNIINRYGLLTDRHVQIIRSGGFFTVKLPLLTQ